jgi:5-methyltetrahydropteroyltriglutamate--homocysteine methyltransferase
MSGIAQHPWPADRPRRGPVNGRDRRDFPLFYQTGRGATGANQGQGQDPWFIVEPIKYTGHDAIRQDIENVKAACAGRDVEPFLPGIAPGTMEHWLWNEYYADDEAFVFALAEVLNEEFKLITDAGVIVQVDDPDLPDGWQMFPDWTVADYRKYATLRVDAINRALEGIPEELVRFHICWGSQHGPHADDIALSEFIDLVYRVKAECYSIEAANPQHEHEWRVFEEHPLPDGKILMPGVVGHASDIIEHPLGVADRIVRYANIVGKENVIAGTDCGLASRVGGPEICWAKLDALGKGAVIATETLFG